MIFVTGPRKVGLEDYFDIGFELETTMRARGKSLDLLEPTRSPPGSIVSVRQQEPLGLGHASGARATSSATSPSRCCCPTTHGRQPGCVAQMVEAYSKVGGNIVCVQEVPREKTASYGVITPGAADGRLTEVRGLVEKPRPEEAPSNLAVVGRYILQPEIMDVLAARETGAGGEIQLTDAMAKLIGTQPFHGLTFGGDRHDCGDKVGFVIANIALSLAREDVEPAVRAYIADIV
jgi:UTP--glucose-1-phosphate uridylyltransferase